jgi:glycosyltransferase involved in cell wall biosynthesis
MSLKNIKAAILVPSAPYGAYWPPILNRLKEEFQELIFFTGCVWPKFDPNTPGADVIQVVGQTKLIKRKENEFGYGRVFIAASPKIIVYLLKFKPKLVFVSGFSIWTAFAILLKPIGRWKIILLYEGSAPNVDFLDSWFRLFCRRLMVKFADSYLSNSVAGKTYLSDVLGVIESKIYSRPYMVSDQEALQSATNKIFFQEIVGAGPKFLFVGQVVSRKGIHLLLDACAELVKQGYEEFTLLIVGDGVQRENLEEQAIALGLKAQVVWLGWVAYDSLGTYFNMADVFVFPTLEDTWGMVVLEAMALGKPVICSKWAGVNELVLEGENGYVVDPYNSAELSESLGNFMKDPGLISSMGTKSKELVAQHTPEEASMFLSDMAAKVFD